MSLNKVRTAPVIRGLGEVTVEPEPVRNYGNLKPLPHFDDSWKVDAACRSADPSLFIAYGGTDAAEALTYCSGCFVVAECRALARLHARHQLPVSGVWGGQVWTTSGNVSAPNTRRKNRILRKVAV